MRKIGIAVFLLFASTLFFQGCSSNNDSEEIITVIHITDNVDTVTTWYNDYVYVVDNGITVSAALTIEPGTVIKMDEDSYIDVYASGSINASGTLDNPIVFTSYNDDSFKGDTNGDGHSTYGESGDWGTILVDSNNSTFTYCEFYYGGQGNYNDNALLEVREGHRPITNCTFAYSDHAGLTVSTTDADITGCTFYGNDIPLFLNVNNTLDDSNMFHYPLNITETNDRNGIWLTDNVSSSQSWGETDVPFVLYDQSLDISDTLTLEEGVMVKLLNAYIDVSEGGALIAMGSASKHVTFTSIYDDSVGGDTPYSAVAASKGDWDGVYVYDNGSEFSYCDFFYGGDGNYDDNAMLNIRSNTSATVDHCVFAHSDHAAMDLQDASPASIVTNNAFYDNTKPLWMSPDFSISGTNIFHNHQDSNEGNDGNGIWLGSGLSIGANRTWGVSEVPYICPTFSIVNDASLTIVDGAVLKFQAFAYLGIDPGSSLINFDDVTFTSIRHDLLGDTNGDGSATSPADGDWDGIYDDNYDPAQLDGTNILYDTIVSKK
jgi:hypothetical protein